MKVSAFIATSVDGFIARENDDLDWLNDGGHERGEENYGYQEFIASTDVLVMGRRTFEKVLSFDEWPYGDQLVVVLSHSLVNIPENIAGTVDRMTGSPAELIQRLAMRGATHLYVDGGKTIQGFLEAGLLDQIIITWVPILIGSGIPLFGRLPEDVRLIHLETHHYPSGFVQSRYEVEK